MAMSVKHATLARKVSGSSIGHSLLFDQNVQTYVSCEGIETKSAEACDITLVCASAMNNSKQLLLQRLPVV